MNLPHARERAFGARGGLHQRAQFGALPRRRVRIVARGGRFAAIELIRLRR